MIRKSIPLFTVLLETPVRSPLLVFICCLTHIIPRFSTFQRRENKSPRGETLCYLRGRIFNYSVRGDYTLFKWLGALAGMLRFVWYILSLNYCNLAVN